MGSDLTCTLIHYTPYISRPYPDTRTAEPTRMKPTILYHRIHYNCRSITKHNANQNNKKLKRLLNCGLVILLLSHIFYFLTKKNIY